MKKYLLLVLLWVCAPFVYAETYDELMAMDIDSGPARTDSGVIREIDLSNRVLMISGYEYHIAPAWVPDGLEVQLLGTTAGAFELLSVDMQIEVTYLELDIARIALSIKEVDMDVEVDMTVDVDY